MNYQTQQWLRDLALLAVLAMLITLLVRQDKMMKNEGYEYRGGLCGSNNMTSAQY